MPCEFSDILHMQWEKKSGKDRKCTLWHCGNSSSISVPLEENKNSDDTVLRQEACTWIRMKKHFLQHLISNSSCL